MKKTKKQYVFNFVSGGWNSVWATNKAEAKKLIVEQFGTFRMSSSEPPRRIDVPKIDTTRILTPEEAYQLCVDYESRITYWGRGTHPSPF